MAEPVTTLAGIKGLFAAAEASAKKTEETRKGILRGAEAAYRASPTQFAKDSLLRSRAYVDGTLLDEIEIVRNVLRSAHETWISLMHSIIHKSTALPVPSSYETMGDRLGILATEHWEAKGLETADLFSQYCQGETISLEVATQRETANLKKLDEEQQKVEDEEENRRNDEARKAFGDTYGPNTHLIQEKENVLPYGRQVKFSWDVLSEGNAKTVSVVLFVQMVPLLVSPTLIPEFVKLKSKLSILKRWTMWRAGEIRFWKDLVFQFDEFERMKKIAKADKEGIFTDFFHRTTSQNKGRYKNAKQAYRNKNMRGVSRNLVNTVLIYSEQTLQRVKAETGFDLRAFSDRERYFRETNSMLIYVVDPMFNKVTLYMNGISGVGEYTFDMFKPKGKNNETVDIIKAIGQMNDDKAPRF